VWKQGTDTKTHSLRKQGADTKTPRHTLKGVSQKERRGAGT